MAELSDIDGIGNTIEGRLNEAGIHSVNELANATLSDLTEAGIGEKRSKSILKQAQSIGATIKSASDVEQEQSNKNHSPSGIGRLDEAFGRGLPEKYIIGVSGEPRAGKTQLVFQCLVNAAIETEKPVVYIETEPERFHSERIKSMCDDEEAFDRIYKIEAHGSLEQQEIAYEAISDNFDEVGLIAIDSFVANFRLSNRFQGRADFKERSNELSKHLIAIQDLAAEMHCPILLTLQVYGNPKQYDSHVPIWGGTLMQHTLSCRLHMSHDKQSLRKLELVGHSGREDSVITVTITENGVEEA